MEGLTVSEVQGHNEPCPFANGTRRENLGNTSAQSATQRRFFVPAVIMSMTAGIGTPSGVPVPLFRFLTLIVSRHPTAVRSDGDGFQRNKESEMSATTHKGNTPEIRPNTSSDSITWVKQGTVVKRTRRKLAERGHYLQITRAGTDARQELGEFAVLNDRFIPISTDCKLDELARFLGVLDDDELIDTPPGKGWRHYVARAKTIKLDGIECITHERLTRDFSTAKAAEKAAEAIEDRKGLAIVGFDSDRADRREADNADL